MSKGHHRTKLLLPDDTHGCSTETEGYQSVKRRWCTAALQMAEDQRTCFFTGLFCNFCCQVLPYPSENCVLASNSLAI